MFKQFAAALILVICAGGLSGQTPGGVPKGAVETKPGVYRFVDKDNKVWIFRKTPFGFQKAAEEPVETGAATPTAPEPLKASADRTQTPFGESKAAEGGLPATKVSESGENVTFERPSPFGVYRWTRKKSELTAGERKLWEAQRPVQADKK